MRPPAVDLRRRLREDLQLLREGPREAYLAGINVVGAMLHVLGAMQNPWGVELQCWPLLKPMSWAAFHPYVHGEWAEVHVLGSEMPLPLLIEQVTAFGAYDWVLSATENQFGAVEARMDFHPIRHLTEELLWWSKAAENPGDPSATHLGFTLLNQIQHRDQIAASGAYPTDLLDNLPDDQVQAWVGVADDGGWLTRCHVERRDEGVCEIAGVETHPSVRKQGWGTLFLQQLMPQLNVPHILYLTHASNQASRALATRVGFVPITRYHKYLYRPAATISS